MSFTRLSWLHCLRDWACRFIIVWGVKVPAHHRVHHLDALRHGEGFSTSDGEGLADD